MKFWGPANREGGCRQVWVDQKVQAQCAAVMPGSLFTRRGSRGIVQCPSGWPIREALLDEGCRRQGKARA
jgi:hypothetical protein